MTVAWRKLKRKPVEYEFGTTPQSNMVGGSFVHVVRSGPHLGDAAAVMDVPEADLGVSDGAMDGGHGVEEALGDLVEGGVAVGEAEQVAAGQGVEFVGAVADAPVLGE
ncbi:hypothetical protein [Pseudonocardia hydrocarbonoxydans]|uniref:hypothetical protein n=1 Tax=Pseudonocardia hydrocarbonoxydans TaxID=76726 RepID=UPI00147712E8